MNQPVGVADLTVFMAIATHGNFRRAAAALGVTPSALSHSLRGLEERLALRLINRTTRSIALTEAGDRLLARLRPALRDIEDALEDLNTFRGQPIGNLRINSARVAARMVVLPLIVRFLARHPGINIELACDNTLSDIVAAGFDAGIRLGEVLEQDMVSVRIGPAQQRSAVVAAPSWIAHYGIPQTPRALAGVPCIRYRLGSGGHYAWDFERAGEALKIEVEGPLTLGDWDIMIDATVAGAGAAYVFEDQVKPYLASGKLVRVLEDWCPPYEGLHLYYPSRRQLPAALRAFVEFIRLSHGTDIE